MSNGMRFIVECGQSHGGSIKRATECIKQISEIKSDNVSLFAKFQMFDPFSLFGIDLTNVLPEYEAQLTTEQYEYLINYGKSVGVRVCASAFDEKTIKNVLKMEGLYFHRSPMIKIASRSKGDQFRYWINEYAAKYGLNKTEIIVSTGDINNKRNGNIYPETWAGMNVCFLYCVPEYPHAFTRKELMEIESAVQYAGLSDHSAHDDNRAFDVFLRNPLVHIYERHFTDDRSNTIIDKQCSIELDELRKLVKKIDNLNIN